MTYRHPSVFAAQALTIDHASHGRLELSLGAAWFDKEHHELGIPFPSPPERFDLLEDALEIVTRLFTGDVVSYDGQVVSLRDAQLRPLPVQQPRPPIWIGGSGPRRTLPLVARYADVVARLRHAQLAARGDRAHRPARGRGGPRPSDILRAGSLSLDDIDTARKHAGEVAGRRLRLPRVRVARSRRRAGRAVRARGHARLRRLRGCADRRSRGPSGPLRSSRAGSTDNGGRDGVPCPRTL